MKSHNKMQQITKRESIKTFRFHTKTVKKLEKVAKYQNRSINNLVETILLEYLNKQK